MERPWSPAPALEPRPRHGAPPGASPRSAPLTIRLTRGAPEDPAPGRHERPPTAHVQGDSGDGAQGAHWPSSSATRSRSSRARSSLQRACSSRTCASSLACSRSAMSRSMFRSLRARPRSRSDSCRRCAGPPQRARSAEALAATRRTRPRLYERAAARSAATHCLAACQHGEGRLPAPVCAGAVSLSNAGAARPGATLVAPAMRQREPRACTCWAPRRSALWAVRAARARGAA